MEGGEGACKFGLVKSQAGIRLVFSFLSDDCHLFRLMATSLIASGTAGQLEEDEKKDCFHLGFYADHRLRQDGSHLLLYCDSGQLR